MRAEHLQQRLGKVIRVADVFEGSAVALPSSRPWRAKARAARVEIRVQHTAGGAAKPKHTKFQPTKQEHGASGALTRAAKQLPRSSYATSPQTRVKQAVQLSRTTQRIVCRSHSTPSRRNP